MTTTCFGFPFKPSFVTVDPFTGKQKITTRKYGKYLAITNMMILYHDIYRHIKQEQGGQLVLTSHRGSFGLRWQRNKSVSLH
jgi:hypothetical protein